MGKIVESFKIALEREIGWFWSGFVRALRKPNREGPTSQIKKKLFSHLKKAFFLIDQLS